MRSTSLESTVYYHQNWEDGKQLTIRRYLDSKHSYLVFKRGTDIAASLLILLLLFPWLFPIIIFLIKLDSSGPVFFKQRRVGFLGKTFWCYKFRTMYVNDAADTRQAIKNDPRVTRAGKFLRNTGLDELPQFINVLLGDMSIVGPRPHMLKDSREFSSVIANYKFRNLAKPGITGMSQVRGCRGPASTFQSIFRRYQWDAYYIRNIGFILDCKIMAETGWLMLTSLLHKDKPIPGDNSVSDQATESSSRETNKKIA
ncbi:MAG TPA: sugar transferase [Puia sp.]|jgi:putative colanic acid biosynthesis UDP-glucose lipid carrier transferase